jgi:hypothetical protein
LSVCISHSTDLIINPFHGLDYDAISRMDRFSNISRPTTWPTQLLIQWVPETLSLRMKQLEHKDDYATHVGLRLRICGATSIVSLLYGVVNNNRDRFTFIQTSFLFKG